MNFTRLHSKSFLFPTLLAILFTGVMLSLLGTGDRKYTPLLRTLIQWDGQHYLSIAATGYETFLCPDNPVWICGNVGWFPLFPLLARGVGLILSAVGLDMRYAIVITGMLCFWLGLLVLYRLVRRRFDDTVAASTLVTLMLFPTSFYFLTAFPYSLYLLLAGLVFLLLEEQRYLACTIPAGLLAVTYPSGVTIALPLLLLLLLRWGLLRGRERVELAAAIAAPGIALFLYGLYYWIRFDDFFLYVHFQAKPIYAHEAAFPLLPLGDALLHLPGDHPIRLMVIFLLAVLMLFYARRIPATWQVFMWAVLLFTPAAGTTDSYYRHVIVAFPLYVMVALSLQKIRRRWLYPLYALASVVLLWIVYLRLYKAGALM